MNGLYTAACSSQSWANGFTLFHHHTSSIMNQTFSNWKLQGFLMTWNQPSICALFFQREGGSFLSQHDIIVTLKSNLFCFLVASYHKLFDATALLVPALLLFWILEKIVLYTIWLSGSALIYSSNMNSPTYALDGVELHKCDPL